MSSFLYISADWLVAHLVSELLFWPIPHHFSELYLLQSSGCLHLKHQLLIIISTRHISCLIPAFLFFRDFIYLFLEVGREGERKGEKHQGVVASRAPPTRDLACNPGMCPRLGIKPATLWFTGQHSVHWATQARTDSCFSCRTPASIFSIMDYSLIYFCSLF